MSHIHIPDGILPVWLWLSALFLTIIYLICVGIYIKRNPNSKKIALVGVFAALMIIAMSIEIIPIAYHIKLSVLTGIILGPIFSVLAIFIVNILLALMGHGGITIIGLNTIIISIEAIIGYYGFKLLRKKFKNFFLITFVVTFIALSVATFANIGIIYLGTGNINHLMHHDHHEHNAKDELKSNTHNNHAIQNEGSKELNTDKHPEHEPLPNNEEKNQDTDSYFDIKKFMLIVIGLSIIGWLLESFITAFIVNYIKKVKPDLLEKN